MSLDQATLTEQETVAQAVIRAAREKAASLRNKHGGCKPAALAIGYDQRQFYRVLSGDVGELCARKLLRAASGQSLATTDEEIERTLEAFDRWAAAGQSYARIALRLGITRQMSSAIGRRAIPPSARIVARVEEELAAEARKAAA